MKSTSSGPCGCRCHRGYDAESFCCPECEPEAYDTCTCGASRYQHNDDEREGSPGGCTAFHMGPRDEP